jgi:NAD(P)-dependent dehydrogenase (short-subunit alcohol dehydrogenase family)
MTDSLPLAGHTAIVTGGLQGIGLATAEELSRQGAHIAVGARRGNDDNMVQKVKQLLGNECLVGYLDVCQQESIDTFIQSVKTTYGHPDILVNAAGVTTHQLVDGHSDVDWDAVININLSGPFRMIRACLPDMKAAKWGRIVNIASTAARVTEATHGAYCASKAGLVGLTKAVAKEGGPYGISCLSVSPAWVETDMLQASAHTLAASSGRSYDEEIAIMASSNPQNRLIQPSEIAKVVAFCCSDAAPGLTMEDIQVNAGALW